MKYEPTSLRDFNHCGYRERRSNSLHTPFRWLLIALPIITLVVLALPSHDANAIRIAESLPKEASITARSLPLPTINLRSTVEKKIQTIGATHALVQQSAPAVTTAITPPEPAKLTTTQTSTKPSAVTPASTQVTQIDTSSADQLWKTVTISKGDSLSKILSNANVPASQLPKIIKSGTIAKKLRTIQPGKKIELLTDPELGLIELNYIIDPLNTIKINRDGDGDKFSAQLVVNIPERIKITKSARIDDSLFIAAQTAAVPEKVIMELANIFGWDIDFALDIRKNDKFSVVYDELYVDGLKIGTGNILAAEFISKGTSHKAIRFVEPKGDTGYFDEKGRSLRKAFIRSPVAFSRISSKFNPNRKHPVLNKIRAHNGVDYAAATGTQVKSTGSGRVVFRGKKGGYGNTIVIKHGTKYSTLYAHLSRFRSGLTTGSRVKQGQTIGYVGKSGLASGPHLHYEFRVNGSHRNPLTVKLPSAQPLSSKYQESFQAVAKENLGLLESARSRNIALQE